METWLSHPNNLCRDAVDAKLFSVLLKKGIKLTILKSQKKMAKVIYDLAKIPMLAELTNTFEMKKQLKV